MKGHKLYPILIALLSIACFCSANSTIPLQFSPCTKLKVSGVETQISREGEYELLPESEWCDQDHASYDQTNGQNYLFFIDVTSWEGWIIGTSKCQNLAGILADDSSASDPTELPQSTDWYELSNAGWIRNRDLSVECLDGGLSRWEIVAIAFGVILFLALVLGLVVCCVTKKKQKPHSASHSARRRRINVAAVCPSDDSSNMTYSNPYYRSHFAPTSWSSDPINDTRYMRNSQPPTSYNYGIATSNVNNAVNATRNTIATPIGPPPVYGEVTRTNGALTTNGNNTIATTNNNQANALSPPSTISVTNININSVEAASSNTLAPPTGPPPAYTSSGDVTDTSSQNQNGHTGSMNNSTSDGRNAAFSPPPQYYE